jgi:phosphoribosylformylglycinamidine synthase II
MIHRIEVGFKEGVTDAAGESVKAKILEHLGIRVESVSTIEVYTIDAEIESKKADFLRERLFTDPIVQVSSLNAPLERDFSWVIEIGYRPGVTDNVARTSIEGIKDSLGEKLKAEPQVYTSRKYLISGEVTREQVEEIASGFLGNELIQRWKITSRDELDPKHPPQLELPEVHSEHRPAVRYYDLNVSDEELLRISREGILALDLPEMKAVQAYYRKPEVIEDRRRMGLEPNPTDAELEAIAQTWSEHCKHKIFDGIITYKEDDQAEVIDSLFKTCIKTATAEIGKKVDWLVSVFHDNAGIVKFDEDWNVVVKVETHNSPSALDPYGGALTGIVGVNRDPAGTGLGAKLIFNTDVFCFAPPDYEKELPPRLLHPKRVFDGVRRGVEHGGNKSGIPTVNGAIVFDDRYAGKPLVFCGTGGILPRKIGDVDTAVKRADPGDKIVVTGGRTGKDGIHGATFSSTELDETSPVSAVQIGDPITQKKMTDFLLEARDAGLYRCITDNGAGGLSCSVGEMARLPGGCELHIDRAPLKYAGLDPWEILLSEAQERMTLAVPPEKIKEFLSLARRRGVEATVLGDYTDSGKFHVLYEGKTIAYLDMDFFHDGVPRKEMVARWQPPSHEEPQIPLKEDWSEDLMKLLSRLNICSKEPVIRQYDHEVQGTSVIKPLVGAANDGPSDAAVIRPLLDRAEGLAVSNGINPAYGDIDTYHMVACVIDEAIRNIVAVGGNLGYIAGLDNFCWPDPIVSEKTPDGEYKLAQLVRAGKALYDYTTAFGVPCISGKDSMKNDYKVGEYRISVPPTLLFSAMGKVDDVEKCVTMDAKSPGDLVYVLGMTKPELGGSQYYALHNAIGNSVPKVSAEDAIGLYDAVSSAIEKGLVRSCHDCSDGGLGVALAETAFAGGYGMELDLGAAPVEKLDRDDFVLFSESQSRFVVTISPTKREDFERTLAGNSFGLLGKVTELTRFKVTGVKGKTVVDADIKDLKEAWQKPLRGVV